MANKDETKSTRKPGGLKAPSALALRRQVLPSAPAPILPPPPVTPGQRTRLSPKPGTQAGMIQDFYNLRQQVLRRKTQTGPVKRVR